MGFKKNKRRIRAMSQYINIKNKRKNKDNQEKFIPKRKFK